MVSKTMAAGEFKAKCLAVMDEVRDKRMPVTITKNGKPVVTLMPAKDQPDPIFGFFRNKMEILGDVMAPIYTEKEYEEFYKRKEAMYGKVSKKRSK